MEFKKELSFLSAFYPCKIILDKDTLLKYSDDGLHDYISTYLPNGFQLSCVEQGFQALKTDRVSDFVDLLNTPKGYEAKLRSKDIHSRKKWTVYRLDIMTMLNKEKFRQNPELNKRLAAIEKNISYDVSFPDYYWGRVINDNYRGQNQLGKILNEERKAYRLVYGFDAPKEEKLFKGNLSKKKGYEIDVARFMEGVAGKSFYVIDAETSGLDPTYWDVIELSALKVNGDTFKIEDTFDVFIDNGYKLPPQIVEFNKKNETGICDELLEAEGLKPKKALALFKEFLGENPYIMGQNIQFDIKFIDKLYYKCDKEIFAFADVVDTLKMSREKIPGKHNLGSLYDLVPNAPKLSFHKSIDDVKATLEVFKWLAQSEYHIPIKDKDFEIPTTDLNLD